MISPQKRKEGKKFHNIMPTEKVEEEEGRKKVLPAITNKRTPLRLVTPEQWGKGKQEGGRRTLRV